MHAQIACNQERGRDITRGEPAGEPTVKVELIYELPDFAQQPQGAQRSNPDLTQWAQELCKDGIIEKVRKQDIACFTTHYTVPKPGSTKKRIVGNFRPLNKVSRTIEPERLSCHEMAKWASQFNWFSTIDLTSGFYNVPVEEASRKYLGFTIGSQCFRYRRLPMGLNNGPAYFSRWMKWALDELPCHDKVRNYQDDIIIVGNTAEECKANAQQVLKRLQQRGAKVNKLKCQLQPKREARILGYEVATGSISAPKETTASIRALINKCMGNATKRQRAQIIGKIRYASLNDRRVGKILRSAELMQNAMPDWDAECPLTDAEIEVYQKALHAMEHPEEEIDEATTEEIFSDASDKAVCIKCRGETHIYEESWNGSRSSTLKELTAVLRGIQRIENLPDNATWRLDNAAGVRIMQKGSCKNPEIDALVQQITHLCKKHKLRYKFEFIAGAKNPADAGSRQELTYAQAAQKAQDAEDKRRARQGATKAFNAKVYAQMRSSISRPGMSAPAS